MKVHYFLSRASFGILHDNFRYHLSVVNSFLAKIAKILKFLQENLISLSKLNLPLIGTFTWHTPPGPYRATTCRGKELNYGSHIYFFDHTHTWRASPEEGSAQCRGHLWDNTNMKDETHQAHTQSSQQGEYGMMMTTAKWYSGTLRA